MELGEGGEAAEDQGEGWSPRKLRLLVQVVETEVMMPMLGEAEDQWEHCSLEYDQAGPKGYSDRVQHPTKPTLMENHESMLTTWSGQVEATRAQVINRKEADSWTTWRLPSC